MRTETKIKIFNKLSGLLTDSLTSAAREQSLLNLRRKLEAIVPDIKEQYTAFKVDNEYLRAKVRNMHAFQISLVQPVVSQFESPTIVDIGDSAGTHIQYLKGLFSDSCSLKCLSVNLEKEAVEKVRQKGIEAIQARAENLVQYDVQADIFLCFEMLEHLMDPCRFLYELSMKTKARFLILTVPYVKKSRIGLYQIRNNRNEDFGAETTHIFELSPEDWKLLFRFTGWRVDHEVVYRQYPRKNWLRLTSYYWRKYDFEGFFGVRLIPDHSWSSRYQDWS
ncbi:MAG: methyltransferase domain-containing protein [Candidatus Omnitrophica bacterium]|nr:methyltransferase domain-containing protein [Candidatus Omnitrophota bacterium]